MPFLTPVPSEEAQAVGKLLSMQQSESYKSGVFYPNPKMTTKKQEKFAC